jgi:hypothetical protein
MKIGTDPKTRMLLWLREKLRKKRNQLVNVLLANADGLGRIIVKRGDMIPLFEFFSDSDI